MGKITGTAEVKRLRREINRSGGLCSAYGQQASKEEKFPALISLMLELDLIEEYVIRTKRSLK